MDAARYFVHAHRTEDAQLRRAFAALIAAGANVNRKDCEGYTPLLRALRPTYAHGKEIFMDGSRLSDLVRLLIEGGADPNIEYAERGFVGGRSALDFVPEGTDLHQYLLAHDATPGSAPISKQDIAAAIALGTIGYLGRTVVDMRAEEAKQRQAATPISVGGSEPVNDHETAWC